MHIAPWNNDVSCQKGNKQASPLRTKTTLKDIEHLVHYSAKFQSSIMGIKESQSGLEKKKETTTQKWTKTKPKENKTTAKSKAWLMEEYHYARPSALLIAQHTKITWAIQ